MSSVSTRPQKMVTRNRGKRTTSYRAIVLAGGSKREPPSWRKKRTTAARYKFLGVVIGKPRSHSDVDCLHEIDESKEVVEAVVENGLETGKYGRFEDSLCSDSLENISVERCRK